MFKQCPAPAYLPACQPTNSLLANQASQAHPFPHIFRFQVPVASLASADLPPGRAYVLLPQLMRRRLPRLDIANK